MWFQNKIVEIVQEMIGSNIFQPLPTEMSISLNLIPNSILLFLTRRYKEKERRNRKESIWKICKSKELSSRYKEREERRRKNHLKLIWSIFMFKSNIRSRQKERKNLLLWRESIQTANLLKLRLRWEILVSLIKISSKAKLLNSKQNSKEERSTFNSMKEN